ncbi:LysR family transcriptional regulator [Azospirillum sp. TSO35-2]|uniref:LysR family transcriptional regulator n=1 Tax=Azospirillum sp. TSO35-2 TaxID=716796 RepID=UPI000D609518|nr:LysR family transcriptional regulator [Azospirillum sp. TSO35-2]PWC37469.1 LysR family transcriptional regulator [Azospirillum sp. TSO35-2]
MNRSGLVELHAVAAVAEHRSFRRAALDLGLSTSALSHAIAALERRLGTRLFHRTTRSVALTDAGEQFLARIRPALRAIDEAMTAANDRRDRPAGTLRLNSSEEAARQILRPVVLEFLRRHPDMRIDLVTEGRLVDIVAEGFDAGIRLTDTVPQDMIAVPFGPPQRFAVVGSPGYLARHPLPTTPADLHTHICIRRRMPSGRLYTWEFARQGEELRIDVPGVLTLDSSRLMLEAVLDGAGLAMLAEPMVAQDLAAGRLIRMLEDWTPPFATLGLYYPGHRHVPAGLRAFITLLRERSPTIGAPIAAPPPVPAPGR